MNSSASAETCSKSDPSLSSSSTDASQTTTLSSTTPPRLYLVICNIQKITNVRALMMTAVAFGCCQVLLVGQDRNASKGDHFVPKPFQLAIEQGRIRLQHFLKWKDCVDFLQQNSIQVIGVEIDETSVVLDDAYEPPKGDCAILMGNEGQGIHPKHLQACQGLIRIPQYGVGTASLNVNVAASIVLYRFHTRWKKRCETSTQKRTTQATTG